MELLLDKVVEEGGEVRSLYFSGKVPAYKPGNFFRLWLPVEGGKRMFRAYSAASHPSETQLRLCIKKNGVFTGNVWKLKKGDRVEVDGPYGNFTLGDGENGRVFIAGGIGITPLRSMLLQTLIEGRRATLFHSGRSLADLPFAGEMKLLELQNHNFRYFPAVTREKMPEGWGGLSKRLSADEIMARAGPPDGKVFYLCGSTQMVGGIVQGLLDAGVKKESVKKEEWG